MIITNQYDLSSAWVTLAKHQMESHDAKAWRSATQLIKPPQIYTLEKRFSDRIEVDVSDCVWLILGSSVHSMLEHSVLPEQENIMSEQRLYAKVDGKTISGQLDRLEKIGHDKYALQDFKITSVYAVKEEVKQEWEQQINILIFLLRNNGYNVVKASIETLLKDWRFAEYRQDCFSKRKTDYEPSPFKSMPVQIWSEQEQVNYIKERTSLHAKAEASNNEDLPICIPEERWAKPDCYAVKKKGGKRAVPNGKHSSRAEALAFAQTKDYDCEVEYRQGENIRCERYCPVRRFCYQYSSELNPPF